MEEHRRALYTALDYELVKGGSLRELYNEGRKYVESGMFIEAIDIFDKYLALDPNDIRVLNNKAYSLANISKFEEAQTIIDKVLQASPEYLMALNTQGFILLKEGRIREAKAWIKKAYDKNPTVVSTSEHLVEVYEKLGDKENARKYRDIAAELKRRQDIVNVQIKNARYS
jgi:tetratricopeptide (TPR) repeat protein